MKQIYDTISFDLSKVFTKAYSTSFSMGIRFLNPEFRNPIYAIYGFVRLADEIVDSFHDYDKQVLFDRFKSELDLSLKERISLNPLLNSFQEVVHRYNIERELIDAFLFSMEMDLGKKDYSRDEFDKYVLGSAEVVGLMCLRIFVAGDEASYQKLKPYGMRLGAAYQKINFLRDIRADYAGMGRSYFPGINPCELTEEDKKLVEKEIAADFAEGLHGIKILPRKARLGVYLSYVYYFALFKKISRLPAKLVARKRIRIPDYIKYYLMLQSYVRYLIGAL